MVLGSRSTGHCVILLPESWKGVCHITTLRHPMTDKGAAFLFNGRYDEILELQAHKPSYGSWLLNQNVQSDGRLLMGTPVDLRFLILPYLHRLHKKSATRSVPVEQLLDDEEFPDISLLSRCPALGHSIAEVADVKDVAGCQAVCLNMGKTMNWIERKVSKLACHLEAKRHDVSLGSKSSSFVQSDALRDASSKSYQTYALGIISEYLPDEIQQLAAAHLSITVTTGITDDEPLTKMPKLDGAILQPLEDYSSNVKAPAATKKPSALEKKLAKVDKSGMKSITAFFGKKT